MEAALDRLNLAFPSIHLALFMIGFANNAVLLLVSFMRTPKELKSYSVMIKIGTINDLISVFCDYFAMPRMVVVPGNMMYLSDGPCALISARYCYLTYCMQMCTQLYTIYVITASFAFRLWILNRSTPKRRNVILVMAALYCPPALVVFTFTFAQAEDEFVRNFLRTNAPSYLSEPGILTGHAGFTPLVIFVIGFCSVTPAISYAIIVFIRHKILIILNKPSRGMSERTRKMHRNLAKALSVHALLPLIFVISVSFYFILFFDIYRHAALEKSTFTVSTIPSVLAPFSTLYYAEPYRRFIIFQFRRLPFAKAKDSVTVVPDAASSRMRSSTQYT